MASTLPAEKERAAAQDHPDSDEDLDDLDDVLDQFTHTSASQITRNESPAERATPSAPPPTATKSAFSRPRTNTRVDGPPLSIPGSGIIGGLDSAKEEDEDALSAEFTKNLAAGMETLMREIAGGMPAAGGSKESTGTGPESSERDKDAERAFKAAWEAMLVEGMDGMGADAALGTEFLGPKGGPASASAKTGVSSIGEKSDFQNKIRQAMDKLKEGESNLQADSTPRNIPGAGGLDDTQSIEALLAQLGELGLGEDGEGDDEELSGFLENMMDRLMSKDVLYEPLKELSENYPPYLANPPKALSPADKQRYEAQSACVSRVLAVFDQPGYSDGNPDMNTAIVDLMMELQAHGSPPAEIMGDLPPGLGVGPDGMPHLGPEGCIIA